MCSRPALTGRAQQLLERAALVEQREQQLLQRAGVAPPLDRHERAELAQQQLEQLVQRLQRVGVGGGQRVEQLREGLEEGGQLLRAHLRPVAHLLDVARGARLEEVVGMRAQVVQLLAQQRSSPKTRIGPASAPTQRTSCPTALPSPFARPRGRLGHHGRHVLAQVHVHRGGARAVRGLGVRLAEQPRDALEHLARRVDRGVADAAVAAVAELQQRRDELLHALQEQARPRRVAASA